MNMKWCVLLSIFLIVAGSVSAINNTSTQIQSKGKDWLENSCMDGMEKNYY